ncbi:acyltransferase [Streptomyces sp. NBC_01294]|nr:acyltransferase [Streptomyces sp. NBC_01294]
MEGLRAVAVLAVLAFHAGIPGTVGGFVGVDVFFVISGYLITGLLVREAITTGRIRLGDFFSRRARRLLPSAAVVLGAVAVAGAWLTVPLRRTDVEYDVVAAALSSPTGGSWRSGPTTSPPGTTRARCCTSGPSPSRSSSTCSGRRCWRCSRSARPGRSAGAAPCAASWCWSPRR